MRLPVADRPFPAIVYLEYRGAPAPQEIFVHYIGIRLDRFEIFADDALVDGGVVVVPRGIAADETPEGDCGHGGRGRRGFRPQGPAARRGMCGHLACCGPGREPAKIIEAPLRVPEPAQPVFECEIIGRNEHRDARDDLAARKRSALGIGKNPYCSAAQQKTERRQVRTGGAVGVPGALLRTGGGTLFKTGGARMALSPIALGVVRHEHEPELACTQPEHKMRNMVVPVAQAPRPLPQRHLRGMVHEQIQCAFVEGAARPLAARQFAGKRPGLPAIDQHKARARLLQLRRLHTGSRLGIPALVPEGVAEGAHLEFAELQKRLVAVHLPACPEENPEHVAGKSLKRSLDI